MRASNWKSNFIVLTVLFVHLTKSEGKRTIHVKLIPIDFFSLCLMLAVSRSHLGPYSSRNKSHIHCRKMEKKEAVPVISNLLSGKKCFSDVSPSPTSTDFHLCLISPNWVTQLFRAEAAWQSKSREILIDFNRVLHLGPGFCHPEESE